MAQSEHENLSISIGEGGERNAPLTRLRGVQEFSTTCSSQETEYAGSLGDIQWNTPPSSPVLFQGRDEIGKPVVVQRKFMDQLFDRVTDLLEYLDQQGNDLSVEEYWAISDTITALSDTRAAARRRLFL